MLSGHERQQHHPDYVLTEALNVVKQTLSPPPHPTYAAAG
jgi:hypothetical protein